MQYGLPIWKPCPETPGPCNRPMPVTKSQRLITRSSVLWAHQPPSKPFCSVSECSANLNSNLQVSGLDTPIQFEATHQLINNMSPHISTHLILRVSGLTVCYTDTSTTCVLITTHNARCTEGGMGMETIDGGEVCVRRQDKYIFHPLRAITIADPTFNTPAPFSPSMRSHELCALLACLAPSPLVAHPSPTQTSSTHLGLPVCLLHISKHTASSQAHQPPSASQARALAHSITPCAHSPKPSHPRPNNYPSPQVCNLSSCIHLAPCTIPSLHTAHAGPVPVYLYSHMTHMY